MRDLNTHKRSCTRKVYHGGINFKQLLATTATISTIPFTQTNRPIDMIVPFQQTSDALSYLHPDEAMFLESNYMPIFTDKKSSSHRKKTKTLKSKRITKEMTAAMVAKSMDEHDDTQNEDDWNVSFKKVTDIYDVIKKSFIDHDVSEETIEYINKIKNSKEYEWKSFVTKHKHDYTTILAPTVKTYGAINHVINVIEASLFTETKSAGWHFMQILKKIHQLSKKHISDGISNKNLIAILEIIKKIITHLLATEESDLKKVTKIIFQQGEYSMIKSKNTYINLTSILLDNMLDRTTRKKFNQSLKETLFSVSWGITIVKYYDTIEERKATAYLLQNLT